KRSARLERAGRTDATGREAEGRRSFGQAGPGRGNGGEEGACGQRRSGRSGPGAGGRSDSRRARAQREKPRARASAYARARSRQAGEGLLMQKRRLTVGSVTAFSVLLRAASASAGPE